MNQQIYRIHFYKNGKLTNALIDPKNSVDFKNKITSFLNRRGLARNAIVRVDKYELSGSVYTN